jgi:hypothetical protein
MTNPEILTVMENARNVISLALQNGSWGDQSTDDEDSKEDALGVLTDLTNLLTMEAMAAERVVDDAAQVPRAVKKKWLVRAKVTAEAIVEAATEAEALKIVSEEYTIFDYEDYDMHDEYTVEEVTR